MAFLRSESQGRHCCVHGTTWTHETDGHLLLNVSHIVSQATLSFAARVRCSQRTGRPTGSMLCGSNRSWSQRRFISWINAPTVSISLFGPGCRCNRSFSPENQCPSAQRRVHRLTWMETRHYPVEENVDGANRDSSFASSVATIVPAPGGLVQAKIGVLDESLAVQPGLTSGGPCAHRIHHPAEYRGRLSIAMRRRAN